MQIPIEIAFRNIEHNDDAEAAIRRIVERRLSKYKDKLEDHGSAERGHEAANEFRGQIAEVMPEKDFGYVMTKEGWATLLSPQQRAERRVRQATSWRRSDSR